MKDRTEDAYEFTHVMEDGLHGLESLSQLNSHVTGMPRNELERKLVHFKYPSVLHALEFGLVFSKIDSDLTFDEKLIATSAKVIAPICAAAYGFFPAGLFLSELAGPFGPAIVLTSIGIGAFKSEEFGVVPIAKLFSDNANVDNWYRPIIEAWRSIKQNQKASPPTIAQSPFAGDLPFVIIDEKEEVHPIGSIIVDNSKQTIRVLVTPEIKDKLDLSDLKLDESFLYSVKSYSPEKDENKIQQVKNIIQTLSENNSTEQEFKNFKQVEDLVMNMNNPHLLNDMLSSAEKNQLELLYESSMKNFSKDLIKATNAFVNTANLILDRKAFEEKFSYDSSSINYGVSTAHTLFNIFAFIDPKKSELAKEVIVHGSNLVKSAAEIVDWMGGGGSVFAAEFAIPGGAFLAGLTGLLKIFNQNGSDNEVIRDMLYAISGQISRLHNDMLEGFRAIAISFGIISQKLMQVLFKIEELSRQNEKMAELLENVQKFLYVDRAYLDGFKKALEHNARYGLIGQINQWDWLDKIKSTMRECSSYPQSLPYDMFLKSINDLRHVVEKTTHEGVARAQQMTDLNDHTEIALALKTFSTSMVIKKDRLHLAPIEQNIHLLIVLIKHLLNDKPELIEQLPQLESICNPAALYEVSETMTKILQKYRNADFYLGLPKEPLEDHLKILLDGINDFESLLKSLSNPKLIEALFIKYLRDIKTFATYLASYIDDQVLKQGVPIYKKLLIKLKDDKDLLQNLPQEKISDIFKMNGTNWFSFQWSHWWKNHWSNHGWNNSDGKYNYPSWPPTNKIAITKNLYQEKHQNRAVKINHNLLAHQYKNEIHVQGLFDVNNFPLLMKKLKEYFLYDQSTLTEFNSPQYFLNNDVPLFVPNWHITKIPQSVFDNVIFENGNLKFSWVLDDNKKSLLLKIILERKENGLNEFISILTQEMMLPDSKIELPPAELIHYLWFGGEMPNSCDEYDTNIKRYSNEKDTAAYNEYYSADFKKFDAYPKSFHRATVCLPHTEDVDGILSIKDQNGDKSEFTVAPEKAHWLETRSYTTISDADNKKLSLLSKQNHEQFRERIFKELAMRLSTGNTESDPRITNELFSTFGRISISGTVIKMILRLLVNPHEIDLDPTFPNIIDGEEILGIFKEYHGQRYSPLHLLEKNYDALNYLLPEILNVIKKSTSNHLYPFVFIKQGFESYIHTIEAEMVDARLAKSKPDDEYKLSEFVKIVLPKLPYPIISHLFERNPDIKAIAFNKAPYLLADNVDLSNQSEEVGNCENSKTESHNSAWPFPGATAEQSDKLCPRDTPQNAKFILDLYKQNAPVTYVYPQNNLTIIEQPHVSVHVIEKKIDTIHGSATNNIVYSDSAKMVDVSNSQGANIIFPAKNSQIKLGKGNDHIAVISQLGQINVYNFNENDKLHVRDLMPIISQNGLLLCRNSENNNQPVAVIEAGGTQVNLFGCACEELTSDNIKINDEESFLQTLISVMTGVESETTSFHLYALAILFAFRNEVAQFFGNSFQNKNIMHAISNAKQTPEYEATATAVELSVRQLTPANVTFIHDLTKNANDFAKDSIKKDGSLINAAKASTLGMFKVGLAHAVVSTVANVGTQSYKLIAPLITSIPNVGKEAYRGYKEYGFWGAIDRGTDAFAGCMPGGNMIMKSLDQQERSIEFHFMKKKHNI